MNLAAARTFFTKIIRSPIVQVAMIGAIVFLAIQNRRAPEADPIQLPIEVSADEYQGAVEAWSTANGTPPTRADEELILDRLAADEALFRRALELGLDETSITDVRLKQLAAVVDGRDEHGMSKALADDLRRQGFAQRDPIVRSHLIQTMIMVARKVDVPPPQELLSFYSVEGDRFERRARYDVEHLYFSTAKRGADAEPNARRVLGVLDESSTMPKEGDRFNAGHRFVMQPAARVAGALGSKVAAAIADASVGQWFGPIESPYGWHLVRVNQAMPAETPPFETISSEVVHTYLRIRGEEKLARTLRTLRLRYGVEVERL